MRRAQGHDSSTVTVGLESRRASGIGRDLSRGIPPEQMPRDVTNGDKVEPHWSP